MKTAIKLVLIYFVMQILARIVGDAFHNALFLRGQRYDR